jgi:GT2 family glycosyltransferase
VTTVVTTQDRLGIEESRGGSQPRVAILILNWNGMRETVETLESLQHLQYSNCEVVLVDNGSTDGSCEAVATAFPTVRLIVPPTNLGVAGGRNCGLEAILQQSDIDYVLFLDNDVTVEPSLLNKLVAAATQDPALGIVGPIVYYHADPQRIWSAGSRFIFRAGSQPVEADESSRYAIAPRGYRVCRCHLWLLYAGQAACIRGNRPLQSALFYGV